MPVIVMDRHGTVIRRSRNLRGLLDHARRVAPVSVEVKDTDGRLAEITRERLRTGQEHVMYASRWEYLVTYRNGDVGRAFFADCRVAADWTANRQSWRPLEVVSSVEVFLTRYAACMAPRLPQATLERIAGRLPVRDDVERMTYHRPPTRAEVSFGHGATHYADFDVADCCYPGTRIPKRWFVSPVDGLRYYR